ncbi:hypothetical protein WN943_022275 [Citrus x changshan-huyou]
MSNIILQRGRDVNGAGIMIPEPEPNLEAFPRICPIPEKLNDEHIRKPRKDPRRKPRIDEHIQKRVEKRAKGPDRRTQYDIYVTVIFQSYRKLEDKVSPKICPVNKWNKFTAIKIQNVAQFVRQSRNCTVSRRRYTAALR